MYYPNLDEDQDFLTEKPKYQSRQQRADSRLKRDQNTKEVVGGRRPGRLKKAKLADSSQLSILSFIKK